MLSKKLMGALSVTPAPTDANFENVTLLLHGDGTNGAQNNTFTDSSSNAFSITRNGSPGQGTFTPYGNNWSNYFDSSSYLTITSVGTAAQLDSSNFTIEAWVNLASALGDSVCTIASSYSGDYGWAFQIRGDTSSIAFYYGGQFNSTSFTPSVGTWYHIAVSRSGNTLYFFVNGVAYGTASFSSTIDTNVGNIAVNSLFAGSFIQISNCYLSNVRLVKGIAVYTAAFTPPTAPLTATANTSLLICQSNRLRDNSSNGFTITRNGAPSVQRFSPFSPSESYSSNTLGGSGFFGTPSGTVSNLSISPSGLSSMSTWTIEFWAYNSPSGGPGDQAILGPWTPNLIRTSGSSFQVYLAGNIRINGSYWVRGQWNYVALSNDGTNLRLYINGNLVATEAAVTINLSSMVIGSESTTDSIGDKWDGYITDFRVVNGTALYSGSTMTVPTAPLSAISGTSLLLKFTNAGIIDNAMMNDLRTIGNAQVDTGTKKFGTGSMYFDGTGDYLLAPQSANTDFGLGDFTVEAWVYPNSLSSAQDLFGKHADSPGSGTDIAWSIYVGANNSGNSAFICSSGTYYEITGWSLTSGQWQHVALTRSSGSLKFFIDGTQVGSTVSANVAINSNSAWRTWIGTYTASSRNFNGYIDDLRITKGVARYTANFTPPTAAFPDL